MPEFKLNGKTYSGSTSYASAISYTEDDGSKTTVQDKISELNSNFDEQNKNMVFPLPDYSNVVSITALPFTAPDNGVAYLVVGGSSTGGRYFYLNGNKDYLCGCTFVANSYLSMSLILSKGDTITSNGGVYGTYTFVPFKKTSLELL